MHEYKVRAIVTLTFSAHSFDDAREFAQRCIKTGVVIENEMDRMSGIDVDDMIDDVYFESVLNIDTNELEA